MTLPDLRHWDIFMSLNNMDDGIIMSLIRRPEVDMQTDVKYSGRKERVCVYLKAELDRNLNFSL